MGKINTDKGKPCSCGRAAIVIKDKCRFCYWAEYHRKKRGYQARQDKPAKTLCSCGRHLIAVKGKCLHCYQKAQHDSKHIRNKKAFEDAKNIEPKLTNLHLQQLPPEKLIRELEKRVRQ